MCPLRSLPALQAGLGSLGSVELRKAVGTAFDIELPATVAFDYPTVASLSKFVASRLPAQQAPAGSSWSDDEPAETTAGLARSRRMQPQRRRKPQRQPAQRATAAAQEAVVDAVLAVAAELLGGAPSKDQPLMEVSSCGDSLVGTQGCIRWQQYRASGHAHP
jgi:hypothetical protein